MNRIVTFSFDMASTVPRARQLVNHRHILVNDRVPRARQLVNHRHILVNDRTVDIPSYRCKPRDIITAREAKIQSSDSKFS